MLGVGPIGLGVLLCLKAAGPCVAYATDLLSQRLAVARRCGADATFDARQDVVAELARREPQGLDCVFECSGDPACLDQGQQLLAPGGKLMMIGIPPDERVPLDPHRARRAELSLQAVRRQRDCVAPTISMIAQARLDPAPLVTHRFRLDEIGEALELAAAYRDGVIKALLDLTGDSNARGRVGSCRLSVFGVPAVAENRKTSPPPSSPHPLIPNPPPYGSLWPSLSRLAAR